MRLRNPLIALISLLLLTAAINADAGCAYSEALLALRHGNHVRAVALMRMAAKDGDARAARYLVKTGDKTVNAAMRRRISADDQARSEPLLWQRVD